MNFYCLCGKPLSNTDQPNNTEHLLLSSHGVERLQDLTDGEVAEKGTIQDWPEHWQESRAIAVWECAECDRLYVFPPNSFDFDKVAVYKIEQIGI